MTEGPRQRPERYARPKVTHPSGEDGSYAELASDVLEHAWALVQAEMRLAQSEVKASARRATKGLAVLAGVVALGLGTVIMGLVAYLAILVAVGLPVWLAAILTTLTAAAGTAGLALQGIRRLRANDLVPGRTLAQLNKDRMAVKEQIR